MPGDLLPTLYLCTGRVAPSHEGIELGVGDSILIKVIAEPWACHVCKTCRSVCMPAFRHLLISQQLQGSHHVGLQGYQQV